MRRVTEYVKSNPGMMLAILACAIILFTTRGMLSKDIIDQSGDLNYHLACEAEVARAINEGRSPFGPISLNFGTPILKFYQPLLYLVTGYAHFVTRVDVLLIHNLLIVFFFALTPFCLRWCYLSIGMRELTSGLAALLTLISVGGFANSYEAYFGLGIISQLLGAVFFPLFIGAFARMLRDGRGPVRAAVLFALAFVAHVMMAVYAVFAGGLLFFVNRWDVKRIWKPFVTFGVLAGLLVAFWFVPFVTLRERFRPEPDIVARPWAAHFNNGLTASETTRLLFTGRLLDDARQTRKEASPQDDDDRLTDKLNILAASFSRPPVLTVITLLGFLLCLTRFRSTPHRFLIAGFIFSFLLIMGPDDVPWLGYLPFSKRIQFFRCTYLLEFFAFGLAASGIEIAVVFIGRSIRKLPGVGRRTTMVTAGCFLVAALGGYIHLVHQIATAHVSPGSLKRLQRGEVVTEPALDRFPSRTLFTHGRFIKNKRLMHYLEYKGYRAVCGHWRVIGATITSDICQPLFSPGRNVSATRKMGIGQYLVNRKQATFLNDVTFSGQKVMKQVKLGGGYYLYADTGARYLWVARPAVLVISNDVQWFQLGRAWLSRLSRTKGINGPPTPIRLDAGAPIDARILGSVDAVWVLSANILDKSNEKILGEFANSGKEVRSVEEIPGAETTRIETDGPSLLGTLRGDDVEEGVEIEEIEAHIGGPFVYDLVLDQQSVVVLPEMFCPGWSATVDGKQQAVFAAAPDFVAAVVPEGRHTVVFQWETPSSEIVYLVISGLTWIFVFVFPVVVFAYRKRKI